MGEVLPEERGDMKEKIIEKPFGIIALELGYITATQLVEAFNIQVTDDIEQKKHRLIGQILLDQGYITTPQVENVVRTLRNQE